MKTAIACLLITALLLSVVPKTHSVTPKTQGKLGLVAILSGVAILTRYLVKRDIRASEKLRAELGAPDRTIEFERGFDQWRLQWHAERQYLFRNNLLFKITKRNIANDE